MTQFAAGLQALGLEAGDRVCLLSSVLVLPHTLASHLCRLAGLSGSGCGFRACFCPHLMAKKEQEVMRK